MRNSRQEWAACGAGWTSIMRSLRVDCVQGMARWVVCTRYTLAMRNPKWRALSGTGRGSGEEQVAVDEGLRGAGGRGVALGSGGGEAEARAELAEDGVCVVALDGEAAAFGGAVGRKGCEDDVAAGTEGARDLLDVGGAVGGCGEKVKDGAVVPEAEVMLRELGGEEVSAEKRYARGGWAKACAGVVERLLGDVEDGEVGVAGGEEVVDERGLASADVEDGCGEIGCNAADESEGDLQMWAVPAACGG